MSTPPVRLVALFVAPLALLGSQSGAAQEPLLDAALRDLLAEELSGELAKDHVIRITRHHRIQGSRGYRDAAEYVLEELRRFGFDEERAWIESFPSDGKVRYQTWQSPSGWDIERGELRMLEPADERIVGFPEIAMSVITYSNPGDVTAELVWVGAGTSAADYEKKDVRGKFVLATGYGGSVHREAVLEHGAAAVVCYLADERGAQYPDMLQYTGMWPRSDELERTTFGFNLTNRQGTRLRELLEGGERVVLRGSVEGIGLEPYFMDVVVAEIEGAELPEQELVFSAHLDHPKESANDNASGSAAILDIARTLQTLIGDGRLPRPRRTLRFLWVPEWYGTMAYIDAHPELEGFAWGRGGGVLANMNMDMVGENTELLHSKLVLTANLMSVPSIVDDVVGEMARMVDGMDIRTPRGSLSELNYRLSPFMGGSDHMMFMDRGVPSVMFFHDPDYTHHTSEDTPDKVDPVELERCELIAAATQWYLANLDEAQAADLLWLATGSASQRLAGHGRRYHRWITDAPDGAVPRAWAEANQALSLAAEVEQEALASLPVFLGQESPTLAASLERQEAALLALTASARAELMEAVKTRLGVFPRIAAPVPVPDLRVPERTTRGPLSFDLPERDLSEERAAWYAAADFPLDSVQRFELVNLVDGTRTVTDLRNFLSAEFEPVPQDVVSRYIDDLVAVGALAFVEGEPREGQ